MVSEIHVETVSRRLKGSPSRWPETCSAIPTLGACLSGSWPWPHRSTQPAQTPIQVALCASLPLHRGSIAHHRKSTGQSFSGGGTTAPEEVYPLSATEEEVYPLSAAERGRVPRCHLRTTSAWPSAKRGAPPSWRVREAGAGGSSYRLGSAADLRSPQMGG